MQPPKARKPDTKVAVVKSGMAIMIDGPDRLLATSRGSSFEPTFYEIVKKSQHWTDALNLDPAVYHWTKKDGLKQVSHRPAD